MKKNINLILMMLLLGISTSYAQVNNESNNSRSGVIIKSAMWNGSQSEDWSNPLNWTPNLIPDLSTEVEIEDPDDAGYTNNPVISQSSFARSIKMEENTSLTNNHTLEVNRDFDMEDDSYFKNTNKITVNEDFSGSGIVENEGIIIVKERFKLTYGGEMIATSNSLLNVEGNFKVSTLNVLTAGTVTLSGTNSVYMDAKVEFHDLKIEKSSTVNINLKKNITINNELSLTQGIITPKTNIYVIVGPNGTSSNSNHNSFVNGPVRKMIGTSQTNFIFPTGKVSNGNKLGRIAIKDITSPNVGDFFTAEYFAKPYGNLVTEAPSSTSFSELNNVSRLEHWILDRSPSALTNAKVQLFWTSFVDSDIQTTPTNDLVVCRFNGSAWENRGSAVNGQKVSTPNIQSNFSPWTFGSESGHNTLPVRILSIDGLKINGLNQINWTTENDPITKQFEVQRSLDGKKFDTFQTLDKKDLTNPVLVYKVIDPIKSNATVYYRLNLIDNDGSTSFSKVISIGDERITTDEAFAISPNPFVKSFKVAFDLEVNEAYKIIIRDLLGHTVHSKKGTSIGNNTVSIDLEHLPKGTYIVQIVSSSITQTKKIIKQ